jgi:serine protease inhibitor
MVELPCNGEDASMLVLLPDESDGIGDLEGKLTLENLGAWTSRMVEREIDDLALPHRARRHPPPSRLLGPRP